MSELDNAVARAKEAPTNRGANTISVMQDLSVSFSHFGLERTVRALGVPAGEMIDFLKINRLQFREMEELNATYHDLFDTAAREAAREIASRAADGLPMCMRQFLATDREVPSSYLRFVLENDNCYFYEFGVRRDRSPAETKVYHLNRSIAHLVCEADTPDPEKALFFAVNESRVMHSTVDDIFRKVAGQAANGGDIVFDFCETAEGLAKDLRSCADIISAAEDLTEDQIRPLLSKEEGAPISGERTKRLQRALGAYRAHIDAQLRTMSHLVFRQAVFSEALSPKGESALERFIAGTSPDERERTRTLHEHYVRRLKDYEETVTITRETTFSADELKRRLAEEERTRCEFRRLTSKRRDSRAPAD